LPVCEGALALPHAQMPAKDTVRKGQDHPLLSRFEGSKMAAYGFKEFEEVVLPAGKAVAKNKGAPYENVLKVEGKYTRIVYVYPNNRSSLEVMRNYQAALAKAGFKTIFSCDKEACGEPFGEWLYDNRLSNNFIDGGFAYEPFIYGKRESRYMVAQGAKPDGSPVHVAVYVVPPTQNRNGGYYLEIVEGKPMETGKVSASLNAADMARSIATEGKVAVYGVYFDTDKAEVKADSRAALGEMAKLLQQDPKLKVHVVGHTDNQGALAHNLELSQRRADAVVKALSTEYKIDAKRLGAKGVGSFAPVASNDDDAGREKNRRVELVKQ
jgi:OOP family OmpA-OmpF porin